MPRRAAGKGEKIYLDKNKSKIILNSMQNVIFDSLLFAKN
jgi:hypothetical protein